MNRDILYREMELGDYSDLLKLVIDTWRYNEWVAENLVAPLAEKFMVETLLNSSQRIVATYDGNLIGVLAADTAIEDPFTILCKCKEIDALLRLTENDTGDNTILHQYLKTKRLNLDMLESRYECYQGLINLLIVKDGYKGFGIGSKLFGMANNYFHDNNVSRFYLFTDSASNVHFYEIKGMRRVREISYKWDENNVQSIEVYYMYEGFTLE